MSADAQGREITFADLLARIGYTTDTPQGAAECMSLCQQSPGSHFSGTVSVWSDVLPKAARLAEMSARNSTNLWFSVNALGEVAGGRGKADDVIRLAALLADLDVKEGACPDLATAYAIIAATSEVLGNDPVAVTHSGHGLQPYWAVEPESGRALLAESPAAAKRLGKRFHALLMKVATEHGCGVDSVFDLPRVFRVPGSTNYKEPENPVPVRCFAGDGKPMTVEQIMAALDAAGIPEEPVARSSKKPRAEKKEKTESAPLHAVTAAMTTGKPSPKVRTRLAAALADVAIETDRHKKTRDHTLALLRYGRNGEPGVGEALEALDRLFVVTVGPDRPGGAEEAAGEFVSFVAGAEDLLATEPPQRRDDPDWAPEYPGSTAESVLGRLAHDGVWLDQQSFPQLEYAVEGIIPEGLGLVVAPPKKGKSWFVASIGLAVASGGLALGAIQVTQRPVLYLALEDGDRRLQSRFRRILGTFVPIPAGMNRITKATPAEAIAAISEFMALHAEEKPLVILDTLGKVKPHKKPGEDSYLADYKVGSRLKELADAVPGSTLLVVHHTRKAEAADFVDTVSGTQGIAGSVDFVLVLTRKRHENNAILSVTGRDIIEAEYALTADEGVLWRLDGTDLGTAQDTVLERRAEASVGDRQMDVYLVVAAAKGGCVTAKDVASQLDGMDNDTAGQYLRRLNAVGHIHKVRRGVFSISPRHLHLVHDSESDEEEQEESPEPYNSVSELSELSESDLLPRSDGINNSDSDSDSLSGVSETTTQEVSSSSHSDTPDKAPEKLSELNTTADQARSGVSDTSDTSDSICSETSPPGENITDVIARLSKKYLPGAQDLPDVHDRIKRVITRRLQRVGQERRSQLRRATESKYRAEFDVFFDSLVECKYLVADESGAQYRLAQHSPDALSDEETEERNQP